MAVDDNLYIVTYKGVQLGDEMTRIAPTVQFQPVSSTRLFNSALAAIRRTTTGKLYRHRITVKIVKADLIAAAAQVEQYGELANGEPGTIKITKGVSSPTLVRTIEDALLEPPIQSNPREDPSMGKFLDVAFSFVTTTRSS